LSLSDGLASSVYCGVPPRRIVQRTIIILHRTISDFCQCALLSVGRRANAIMCRGYAVRVAWRGRRVEGCGRGALGGRWFTSAGF
jgi:hypothetical protein